MAVPAVSVATAGAVDSAGGGAVSVHNRVVAARCGQLLQAPKPVDEKIAHGTDGCMHSFPQSLERACI